ISVTDTPGRSHSRNYYFGGIDIPVKLPNGYTLDGGPGYTCLKRCQAFFVGGGAKNCGDICEPFREREYCQMMIHEVGHLMALPDEYADPACPAQKASQESFPYSAMGFPYAGLLDMPEVASLGGFGVDTGLVEFFPRHIRTITGPLCDPGSPEGTAQGVLTWGEGYLSSP
ncbi:MAG TPA: hypothetical protein VL588_01925, partial [Bdellovibrionota bacterium]|nr:hypothetical protein [Bdellovibrionota bacterium]